MMDERRAAEIGKAAFWGMSFSDAAAELMTDSEQGLLEEEALSRLEVFGPNVIEQSRQSSRLLILLNQFKSPLILVLLLAAGVTLFIGHYRDAFFILAAVIVNTILGFYQEFKAEEALAELKTYLKQRSRVIRGEKEYEIDAAELVPGDCIRLAQGDRVPADARLTFVNDFQIDEAILTGESLPVSKSADPSALEAALGDQFSMVFAGTLVTQGIGTAIVCRTGLRTELGKIAALVADSGREETPLQKKIRVFSAQAGIVLSVLTVFVFVAGILLGYSYVHMFLTAVAIAVAAVPEGLPVAMTVILAIGVQRMARRKGVVRKLVAAEALGSTTIILTDKTGTLTQAKMALSKIVPVKEGVSPERILELALMNTSVLVENPDERPDDWHMDGRVVEVAIVRSAATRGIRAEDVKQKISYLSAMPFNAVNKFSVSLVREHATHYLIFLGAPDILVRHSTLSHAEQEQVAKHIGDLARAGELVMGVAIKEVEAKKDFVFSEDMKLSQLSFQGLLTMHDPVRPNVKDAIRRVELAGIRTIIMSGDHRGTVEAIAREVGMTIEAESALDAEELRQLSDMELQQRLPAVRVISRVSPLDKMRVVRVLQDMGEVVAMTGDGVNDAPSIKQADIGIAMGSGTEVARDVADLVLLDDNFETIVAAVEEGRQIMQNIRKVLVYFLSSISDELILIGGALAMGVVLPLNALQMLWVNFFSDSFPAIAFAFEKNSDGTIQRSAGRETSLFNPLMKVLILYIGLATSILLFIVYLLLLEAGFAEDIVKTFIFASFGSYTLFLAFPLRNMERSIFTYSPFSNPYMIAGAGAGILLLVAAIYIPFLQATLGTVALPFPWILGVVGIGLFNIVAVEIGKWMFRPSPASTYSLKRAVLTNGK